MKPDTSTREPAGSTALLLRLSDPDHLFNAPRVDPSSQGPLEGRGVSGVEYVLELLHLDRKRQRTRTLALLLPADKTEAVLLGPVTGALRRHVQWQVEHERREMRNTYRYGWKVAVFSVVMLVVCVALSSIFASELTQWMQPLIRKAFESGFEIIGWVILWHPIDVLVFSPVAIRARLSALQALASMDVVIRAEPIQ